MCYEYNAEQYLPLLRSEVHSTILSTTSRTTLKQIFKNPSATEAINECTYAFPLYDGVSVVSFTCRVGKKILRGLVKEKFKAKAIFDSAVARGETAGFLEQSPEASDMFSTKLGNIPAGESVVTEIIYIGELEHHDVDGIRFTIPTKIAPRYGSGPDYGRSSSSGIADQDGIRILVDINMPEGSFIKGVQSPSHPVAVSMGTLSTASTAVQTMSKASATLPLGSAELEKDFVLIIHSKDIGNPKAILETHPSIPNHRTLMVSLVPKFSLPPSRPEIVIVADRSGSMENNIPMLISAMNVLLKSMPTGVKFNICSFGSTSSFLWEKSQSYTKETLDHASRHVKMFSANFGGTETFGAIKATIKRRWSDLPLELILVTDGDIQDQTHLFQYVNQQVEASKGNIHVFPLGIGNGVSSALIEGLARAGNGFSQSVQEGERLDGCIVRMLRGALTPHTTDCTLEVKYDQDDDDFEAIEKVTDGPRVLLSDSEKANSPYISNKSKLLFDASADPEKDGVKGNDDTNHYLPKVPTPKLLQAPHKIPSLYSFSRTSVYLFMSSETMQRNPTSVILRATSAHGPFMLEIPIELLASPAETIHQLGAKKAVQDLEEGRGWIFDAKNQDEQLVKDTYPSCFDDLVKREAVRLGETFQIVGKWCSFVAVAANDEETAEESQTGIDGTAGTDDVVIVDDKAGVASSSDGIADEYEMIDEPRALPKRNAFAGRALRRSAPATEGRQPWQPWQSDESLLDRSSEPTSLLTIDASPALEMEFPFGDMEPQSCSNTSQPVPMDIFHFPSSYVSPQLNPNGSISNRSVMCPPVTGSGSGYFGGVVTAAAPVQKPDQASGLFRRSEAMPTASKAFTTRRVPEVQAQMRKGDSRTSTFSSGFSPAPPSYFPPSPYHVFPSYSPTSPISTAPLGSPTLAIPASSPDKVLLLINLQHFDGFWAAEIENSITLIMDITDSSIPKDVNANIWLTILVIKFLREKCAAEQGTWELVVEKAQAWLNGCSLINVEALEKEASLLLA
ncbi:related to Vault poly[ADP-ribose] polymerase [Rhynchosporium agropyri]|uniref:Related to Vault poly[ADP-ribose] polymerase n=1 Tax=Rhynchosporium agropyri TaxID=914238 RepID=A0A1E1LQX2_9HELO|nr:related to Vault poly[ADP-ribose] polymerase [Rhynchosporium agropyri]